MRLFYSSTSPFARIVRVALIEKDMADFVEPVLINPLGDTEQELIAANPLGKVPTLITQNGTALFDSRVICEYLDGLSSTPMLIPAGAKRIEVMRAVALANGILDAAFNLVMEYRRPNQERSSFWQARWQLAIARGLGAVDFPLRQSHAPDLAGIALVCTIDYLRFRLPEIEAPAQHQIVAWQELSTRESFRATMPAETR